MTGVDRRRYAELLGPTVGDRVRLADTDLWIEVEEDRCAGGDEAVFGGGKTIRESMLQGLATRADGAPDLVITNVVVLDHWGVVKCDVGVRDGRIVALGKAGNPDVMDGVHPDLVIGPGTDVVAGEGRILTAGAIDCHVHFITPTLVDEALASGVTTLVGGGAGPTEGTRATTCTTPAGLELMHRALDTAPVNVLLLGRGNTVSAASLDEQVLAGAAGFKLHEDWGSTPAAIDACLRAGERWGIQTAIHTDTLNEAGYLESTLARDRRAGPSTPTTPRARAAAMRPTSSPSPRTPTCCRRSTNPTRPHTINTLAEHQDMLIVCHHLNPRVPEDLAFAESRIRASTMAAEDVLHDLGAISMIGSDSQAMGRVGETIIRTWQTAHAMKLRRGALPGDGAGRQRACSALRRQVLHLPGGGARDRRHRRVGGARQARRPRALGPRVLRDPAAAGAQGRRGRLGADRRRQRVDPDAAAGLRAADVRRGAGARRRITRSAGSRRRRWTTGSPSACGSRGGSSRSATRAR